MHAWLLLKQNKTKKQKNKTTKKQKNKTTKKQKNTQQKNTKFKKKQCKYTKIRYLEWMV